MKFRTTILSGGKTTTGIHVPDEVVAALGTSRKPAVKVALNGYSYRSTVASMGGRFMVGVSADVREKSGVKGDFTFATTGFVNHSDQWALRPSPARTRLREWLAKQMK